MAVPRSSILAHRGFWRERSERNTLPALDRAFARGWGVETDVRDLGGALVVSHDPPAPGALPLEELLRCWSHHGGSLPMALNIKADGLQEMLRRTLEAHGVRGHFVFDMSVPDTLGYLDAGFPVFVRQSEFEPSPVLGDRAQGVWMDGFHRDWMDAAAITVHLDAGKRVCLVSPEIHGRDPAPLWRRLSALPAFAEGRVLLCTDHPDRAERLCHGQD